MTTTRANAEYLESLADTRRVISQAAAEGRVARGEAPTWRENALERAGDYAVAAQFQESRKFAKLFQEG
jgi:hypothetical protein